ncbi:LysR substrate-binding domain-containing protein [Pseudomonas citri]|uniref:LysR substrate-binding domain-containing protein n=1 Tax=Pseudomonas citri TaxID=2978349 RepID=UPI0021B50FF7|nr:LysR substrate-binding domain-containing protein [Pseudomonas citri]
MLNDIAIFVQIVRSGNLSIASKKLGVPANTLSRRLANLEQLLGTPLLFRSTRALRCTPAGEQLYNQSFKSVDTLLTSIESLRHMEGQPSGKARVQVSSSFFEHSEYDFLQNFFNKYPDIELELIVADVEPNLTEDGIDLLLRVGKPKKSSYVMRKLCDVTLGLYASEEYLIEHGTPQSIDDLIGHEHIQFLGQTLNNTLTLKRFDEFFSVPIRGRFSSNSMLGLINAATQGLGIALLNNVMIQFKRRELIHVLPEYFLPTDGYYAVFPNQKSLSPAARTFLDYVIDKTANCSP